MSSKRADGDAWQTEHPRRRQLPSRRLERERQEALERRAVIDSQRQLQWEDDEDDNNRTYITHDEVIELLRDMERYRQKIAAAASLFESWLATITAPLPVGSSRHAFRRKPATGLGTISGCTRSSTTAFASSPARTAR